MLTEITPLFEITPGQMEGAIAKLYQQQNISRLVSSTQRRMGEMCPQWQDFLKKESLKSQQPASFNLGSSLMLLLLNPLFARAESDEGIKLPNEDIIASFKQSLVEFSKSKKNVQEQKFSIGPQAKGHIRVRSFKIREYWEQTGVNFRKYIESCFALLPEDASFPHIRAFTLGITHVYTPFMYAQEIKSLAYFNRSFF